MSLRFTKMHGTGNDYVYVNGFDQAVRDPGTLAEQVSDRHFGIGGDGLILILPPTDPDNHCRMEMYNADGSRAEMCGNGIRCVAKYAHDHGIAPYDSLRVETDAGVKTLRVARSEDGTVDRVEVNMGAPRLRREEIPFVDGQDPRSPARNVPLEAAGRTFLVSCVSMGNPHAVVRVGASEPGTRDATAERTATRVGDLPLSEWGPAIEHHPWFPERTNVEFIFVRSRREIDFRVWERGSGETLACGTGACAAVVASVLNGWCEREVQVHLRGGDLTIRWEGDSASGDVFLTGPAVEVFHGELGSTSRLSPPAR